jgi:hypothetical protein
VLETEVLCGVRGIGELPVQICTEVKFGISLNWYEELCN